MDGLFPNLRDRTGYETALRRITCEANTLLFGVVEDLADAYETGTAHGRDGETMRDRCGDLLDHLLTARNAFVGRNQDVLLESLKRDALSRVA
jgi:hypothetical protein